MSVKNIPTIEIPKLLPGPFSERFFSPSEYCDSLNLMGHLVMPDGGKCKHSERRKYLPESAKGHIAITPHHAIRWAINSLTNEGDVVLDPFAGSGTTGIESIFQKRKFKGCELEFPEVTKSVLSHFDPDEEYWELFEGDSEDELSWVDDSSCALVNFSNPYPDGGDHNQTKPGEPGRKYNKKDNAGLMKGDLYWDKMRAIQNVSCQKLKIGGHAIFVIKDMVRSKKIYPLHEILANLMPSNMELQGTVLLEHYPPTLFMNTYQKQYPEVKHIPLEQICPIFKKVSE